jgi:hypothetical protein
MTAENAKSGRLQLILIALVFLGPLAAAAWLYFGGSGLAPESRSNHGVLLEPIVTLDQELPGSPVVALHEDAWLLIYAHADDCADECRERLYTLRQSRLMLGKEMDRLRRVFLHGNTPPDTVFLDAEHADLVTLEDPGLQALLDAKKPTGLPAGGFYLVDPLGNLVMYFEPGIDPYEMVDDMKRLLKLSRIG